MKIRLSEADATYIWQTMRLKDAKPLKADDECWEGDGQVYTLYQFDRLVIRCVYDVIDSNAEMDTDNFADWANPSEMYVETDLDPDDVK